MEHTPAQLERYARIKRDFGRPYPKLRAPTPPQGHACVVLQCQAGEWHWWFDANGDLVAAHLTGRLFDVPTHKEPPRNALDN